MFGFGKKIAPVAPSRAKRSEDFEQRKAQSKAQLGAFMGLEEDTGGGGGAAGGSIDLEDDELEKELLMLLDGGASPVKKKSSQTIGGGSAAKIVKEQEEEDVAEGSDEDEEVDLDDPDLHAELGEILGEDFSPMIEEAEEVVEETPPPPAPTMSPQELLLLLQERLKLYEEAKGKADLAQDSAKSRRFTRGIKTLKEQLGKVQSGKMVLEEEIPPAVSLSASAAPPPPPPTIEEPLISLQQDLLAPSPRPHHKLQEPLVPTQAQQTPPPILPRKAPPPPTPPPKEPSIDYKALKSMPVTHTPPPAEPPIDYKINEAGQERLKEYKIMAVVLKRSGDLEGALNYLKLSKALETALNSQDVLDLLEQFPPIEQHAIINVSEEHLQTHPSEVNVPPPPQETEEDLFHAPSAPTSILEALEQRLEKYKSEVEKANESSNSSKARRMGRIVKQYEDAIGLYKKGKVVPYEDLPAPPGFGIIPLPVLAAAAVNIPPVTPPNKPSTAAAPSPPSSSIDRGAVGGKPVNKLTLQEKQLREVLLRQKQYRDAAIEAKKRGDVTQAREYLRVSKGFDNLIEASKGGLPVDLKTLPVPPGSLILLESEDFELVESQDCIVPKGEGLSEVYSKLEEDLKAQLKMCMRTREHFRNIGDIASANRFETMALETKKDLDSLRVAAKTGQNAPKYHYENRVFSITECNTDIKQDEIEVTIVRGINYKAPDSIDTFLRVELPYPSAEEAQVQKSNVTKDSINPEYNVTYKMNINRTARNFTRFVHRHGVKVEVWSKGGFLRSSSLFGTATVKLQPLENKTQLHDAFDLLDGRKIVGKVEVKLRLRDPVLTKEISQRKEKWLSIDRS